ncbi:hypothetical protein MJO29_008686 [Puccinia striiformis f. sp. tritici]|nr:hypothetical protein MJO29_008686 [Puccinia striiformis f. sp. tritici]KAI9610716.1 hypothetical protein KEM48_002477 [Puccinia striiformis f. sp. tritici PST-130]
MDHQNTPIRYFNLHDSNPICLDHTPSPVPLTDRLGNFEVHGRRGIKRCRLDANSLPQGHKPLTECPPRDLVDGAANTSISSKSSAASDQMPPPSKNSSTICHHLVPNPKEFVASTCKPPNHLRLRLPGIHLPVTDKVTTLHHDVDIPRIESNQVRLPEGALNEGISTTPTTTPVNAHSKSQLLDHQDFPRLSNTLLSSQEIQRACDGLSFPLSSPKSSPLRNTSKLGERDNSPEDLSLGERVISPSNKGVCKLLLQESCQTQQPTIKDLAANSSENTRKY